MKRREGAVFYTDIEFLLLLFVYTNQRYRMQIVRSPVSDQKNSRHPEKM